MCGVKVGEKRREEHQRERGGKTDGRVAAGEAGASGTSSGQISGCFFANAGVGPGDDDRFPIQPLLRGPAMAAHVAERDRKRSEGGGNSNILNSHKT